MWSVVEEDVCENIRDWFDKSRVPHDLCQAIMCLIPKQHPPEMVKHLRPISLCNTIYKHITKIVVNRFKTPHPPPDLPKPKQFYKREGTKINLVVASKILHSMHKKKGKLGWFAQKSDLEKAYDRVVWSFVRASLQDQNLDDRSIALIMSCITQSSSAILVNGRATRKFNHTRGFRQGDPMSPYLFNICPDSLTQLINQATHEGEWTPFWVGKDKVQISHVMFADDLTLFGRVDENTAFAVKKVLNQFCETP